MEFILMQSLGLIHTKNLFVSKNMANKIATVGEGFWPQGMIGLD